VRMHHHFQNGKRAALHANAAKKPAP